MNPPQPPLGATPSATPEPSATHETDQFLALAPHGINCAPQFLAFTRCLERKLRTELSTARAALALAEEQLHHEQNEARKAAAVLDAAKVPTNGQEGSGKRQDLSVTQRIEKLVAALAQCEERLKQLEEVRLAALRQIAIHVGSIPESHLENNRIEHGFVLAAHRILATGEPNGVLKTAPENISAKEEPTESDGWKIRYEQAAFHVQRLRQQSDKADLAAESAESALSLLTAKLAQSEEKLEENQLALDCLGNLAKLVTNDDGIDPDAFHIELTREDANLIKLVAEQTAWMPVVVHEDPNHPGYARTVSREEYFRLYIETRDQLKTLTAAHAKALEDGRRLDWLASHARYTSPSWGYHKGFHEVQVSSPSNWSPGKQDTLPDTPTDFRAAIDSALAASAPATTGKDSL